MNTLKKALLMLTALAVLIMATACGPSATQEELTKQQAALTQAQAELTQAQAGLVAAQTETEKALREQRVKELQQQIEVLKAQVTELLAKASEHNANAALVSALAVVVIVVGALVALFLASRTARELVWIRALWPSRSMQLTAPAYAVLPSAERPAIEGTVISRRLTAWQIPGPVLHLLNTGQYQGAVTCALDLAKAEVSIGGRVTSGAKARIKSALFSYAETIGAKAEVEAAWQTCMAPAEASV